MSEPKLRHLIVEVTNMNNSVAFYQDVLGATVSYQSEHWSTVNLGGTAIGLHSAAEGLGTIGFVPCFTVDKFEDFTHKVDLSSPHDVPAGIIRTVIDPDGHPIQLLVNHPTN